MDLFTYTHPSVDFVKQDIMQRWQEYLDRLITLELGVEWMQTSTGNWSDIMTKEEFEEELDSFLNEKTEIVYQVPFFPGEKATTMTLKTEKDTLVIKISVPDNLHFKLKNARDYYYNQLYPLKTSVCQDSYKTILADLPVNSKVRERFH